MWAASRTREREQPTGEGKELMREGGREREERLSCPCNDARARERECERGEPKSCRHTTHDTSVSVCMVLREVISVFFMATVVARCCVQAWSRVDKSPPKAGAGVRKRNGHQQAFVQKPGPQRTEVATLL
jgi:hypothetical protein